jgi:hypothetical protein
VSRPKGLENGEKVAEFVQSAVTGYFTWAHPVLLRKGSTGNRCTAGFRSDVCPLRVDGVEKVSKMKLWN